MLKGLSRLFLGLGLSVGLAAAVAAAAGNESAPKKPKRAGQAINIKIAAWGPAQQTIDAAVERVERSAEVQSLLQGAKYRLLEFTYLENEDKSRTNSQPPTRFRAVFYNYTNDRSIVAESDFAAQTPVVAREEYYNPTPTDEEFGEAVTILKKDKRFAALLNGDETISVFQPMPPTTVLSGTIERLVNVGLRNNSAGENEIVSVSINRGEVTRYPEKAPPQSKATAGSCGPSNANQSTTPQNTAGQYQLTATQNGAPLWEMLIIRPAASSGTRKSGIEIRDVKYKGKSVLKRGHVPVLNVQYIPLTCGPYRDWQWQEDMFATPANSTDPAPGIRLVPDGQTATTILETGVDTGNFRGVAVYKQDNGFGQEIVLITELQAGWYRYIHEWRFAPDGTIRPRYGFGATNNNCVCEVHNHHAYWRFDFDIVQPNNKVFQMERGRKFQQPITLETRGNKNHQTRRSLLIQNSAGDEAYMLVPNKNDGVVDTFGVNDFWVLRYKNVVGGTPVQNEIDDGETCVNCTNTTAPIRINPFVNGESVVDQDVVVWYGAHFIHNDGQNLLDPDRYGLVLSGSHVVGPDIRPVRW